MIGFYLDNRNQLKSWKLVVVGILLIGSLTAPSQANPSSFQSPIPIELSEDLKTNESSALISWILCDDRDDFQLAPKEAKELFVGPNSVFRVPEDRYIHLNRFNPLEERYKVANKIEHESFENTLGQALDTLDGKENPIVYIFIDSHGNQGSIDRQYEGTQCLPTVSHHAFAATITKSATSYYERNHTHATFRIFYNACHAHSIVESIHQFSKDRNGEFSNGSTTQKYKVKIDLFTASDASEFGYGLAFLESIDRLSTAPKQEALPGSRKVCHSKTPLNSKMWRTFCLAEGDLGGYGVNPETNELDSNDHHVWSTYQEFNDFDVLHSDKLVKAIQKRLEADKQEDLEDLYNSLRWLAVSYTHLTLPTICSV